MIKITNLAPILTRNITKNVSLTAMNIFSMLKLSDKHQKIKI